MAKTSPVIPTLTTETDWPTFRRIIGTMTERDLRSAWDLLKARRAQLEAGKMSELFLGQRVWFNAKTRGRITGTVIGFNRSSVAIAQDGDGFRWRVSAGLVHAETDNGFNVAEI